MPDHRAATVEFDHVTKHYDRPDAAAGAPGAVDDLSLAVPAGRICVLVGPSGCGKTTTLKMVNRLVEPTGGRVLVDGVDVASRDLVELRRSIGYVIQHVGLFPHQSVGDNVATVPRLLGWTAGRRRERVDELLASVGASPHSTDVIPKLARPMPNTRRRPNVSPSAPARTSSAASTTRYPLAT